MLFLRSDVYKRQAYYYSKRESGQRPVFNCSIKGQTTDRIFFQLAEKTVYHEGLPEDLSVKEEDMKRLALGKRRTINVALVGNPRCV